MGRHDEYSLGMKLWQLLQGAQSRAFIGESVMFVPDVEAVKIAKASRAAHLESIDLIDKFLSYANDKLKESK